MSIYNFSLCLTAFDAPGTGLQRKPIDWRRSLLGINCLSPQSPTYRIPPSTTQAIFSGVRSTSFDDDTQLTLTLSPLASNRYRFTWTAGTAPVFRTDRALTPNGHVLTVALAANGTITVTSGTSGEFTSVQVGDSIWVPGLTTGDSSNVFDEMNVGLWVVLGKTGSTVLNLSRPTGTSFQAIAEAVTVTNNAQFQAFGSTGVQVGDKVNITSGFATPVLQIYTIDVVNSKWFEVLATGALPVNQVGVPTTDGLQFYTSAKKFVYIEVDQEAIVRFNGDVSNLGQLSPLAPGDKNGVGIECRNGPVWQLDIVNRSTETMEVLVASVE